jgi:cytochrome P450
MLHDENDYPDPESFKPERYLKNGLPDLTVRDPTTIVFGFGRRWAFCSVLSTTILRAKKKSL